MRVGEEYAEYIITTFHRMRCIYHNHISQNALHIRRFRIIEKKNANDVSMPMRIPEKYKKNISENALRMTNVQNQPKYPRSK